MGKQQTFSFTISEELKKEMIDYFEPQKKEKTPPYALFQASEADTVVTLYESNKVVFQGISADIDANMWKEREKALTGKFPIEKKKDKDKEKKKEIDNTDYYFISSVGSDEVGTGDYFGPIIVTASFVSRKDIPFLENLGVRDSKMLTDEKILKIAPELIKKIPHSIVTLSNKEYNENHLKGVNMNKAKALLHNKALYNLLENNKFDYDVIVIDQFVNKTKYYEYLNEVKHVVRNINFTTKAEDKCLSVGCSSIISRYVFLNEMDKLNKKLGIKVPLGSGSAADVIGKEIVKKYGKEKLNEIAKISFKNTDKILGNK